jgi:sugar lactone lactonase YvrE
MEKAIEAARRAYEEEQKVLQEKLRSDPAWHASHQQTAVIKAAPESKPVALNNFCLNLDGNLLVACGGNRVEFVQGDKPGEIKTKEIDEPAEIRVLSPGGKLLKAWSLEFKPGALCVAADGTIYVAGDGRLAKFDQQGKMLAAADSPAVVPDKPAPKKEGNGEEKKDEKPKSPGLLGALLKSLGLDGSSDQQEETDAARAERSKQITGIAATDRDLFVCCPMRKGWGYAVWRMDHSFAEPKQIIEGLAGCCGQMDIQAKDGEVWVAHNGKHRVERYDRDGKELSHFGKRDRKAADGFGGCCEPKNLRFAQNGDLLACESGPPVAVKRFTTDGKLLGVIAIPVFNSGCVRVTVDMSRDGSQVFVLNEGERAIHVLTDKRTVATHKQTAIFPLLDVKKKPALHTFCLDGKGNLLVACGGRQTIYVPGKDGEVEPKTVGEPAEIRVLDPEGKLLHTWELDFTPQAINVDDEGTIYVGGDGHLAKLDQNGKVLLKSDSPQMSALPPLPPLPEKKEPAKEDDAAKEARKKKIDELQAKAKEAQEEFQKAMKEAGRPPQTATPEQAQAYRGKFQGPLEKLVRAQQELSDASTPPEALAMRKRMAILQKASISAIAVSGKDVFVACPMTKGFGYAVWRTDADFGNAERIVEGLSGCCGQMDIQARDGKIYAAENARKRVICYDRDGKQLASWGKNERGGPEGFGSCCNPMNLRIGSDGNVYTSESNVGRIKRFTPEGKFLGLIGAAEIVPGCKHVAIGVNGDGSRVYLLDITRSQVVLLTKKEPPNSEKEAEREKLEQK